MSKRSSSSVPTTADRARLKRRMESPVSRSDRSEAGEGSDCNLMAPLPLSCVYAAPPLVGPASSVGEDELADWRSRYLLPSSVVLRVIDLSLEFSISLSIFGQLVMLIS
ncbi:hypothetical protein YC2023_060714 [Brassica napus]